MSVVFNEGTNVKNDSTSNRSRYSRMDEVKYKGNSL